MSSSSDVSSTPVKRGFVFASGTREISPSNVSVRSSSFDPSSPAGSGSNSSRSIRILSSDISPSSSSSSGSSSSNMVFSSISMSSREERSISSDDSAAGFASSFHAACSSTSAGSSSSSSNSKSRESRSTVISSPLSSSSSSPARSSAEDDSIVSGRGIDSATEAYFSVDFSVLGVMSSSIGSNTSSKGDSSVPISFSVSSSRSGRSKSGSSRSSKSAFASSRSSKPVSSCSSSGRSNPVSSSSVVLSACCVPSVGRVVRAVSYSVSSRPAESSFVDSSRLSMILLYEQFGQLKANFFPLTLSSLTVYADSQLLHLTIIEDSRQLARHTIVFIYIILDNKYGQG